MSTEGTGAAGAAGAAGGTGTPAAAAPPAAAPPATPPQATGTEWTSGLSDDLKGFVQTKGFQAPKDVIESFRNLEKLMGVPQERIVKLPDNMDGPEARAIWERLGAPKDAKEYNLEVPPEIGDKALAEWAAGEFHKLGMPRKMAEGFIKAWNEKMVGTHKANQEAHTLAIKQAGDALQKEWGAAFEQNKNIADAAARKLEMSKDEIAGLTAALGPEKTMKALYKLGLATGEHSFIMGQPAATGVMTPEQARHRIKELTTDRDFVGRLTRGDAEAKRQWQTAHEMAYPGDMHL